MELTQDVKQSWYAIHVKSMHEFKVLDRLTGTGIEAFLPVVERLSKWKDRKKLVAFPLFPGYMFVHITIVILICRQLKVLRIYKEEYLRAFGRGSEITNFSQKAQVI